MTGSFDSSAADRFANGYGRRAIAYHDILDETLRPVARRLVELSEIAPGDLVVDIATGTGGVAREAHVAGARVVGIDVSAGMINVARSISPNAIDWLVGDVARMSFEEGTVNAVTCGFGLSHVDAPSVLRMVRGMLRTDGTFVEAAWGDEADCPAFSAVLKVLKEHTNGNIHAFAGILDEGTWANAARGRQQLVAAGFSRVDVASERMRGTFRDSEHAWQWALTWPDYGETFDALEASVQKKAHHDAIGALRNVSLDWSFTINYYCARK